MTKSQKLLAYQVVFTNIDCLLFDILLVFSLVKECKVSGLVKSGTRHGKVKHGQTERAFFPPCNRLMGMLYTYFIPLNNPP